MKDYEVCLPENEEWCVPASLQTVLRSRGIEISQTKIAENFPDFFEGSIFRGFEFSEELLQKFFRKNSLDLRCNLLNPFTHFGIHDSTDLFLEEIKKSESDLLVAYDSKFHQGETRRERMDHLAVFLNYFPKSSLIRVTGIGREYYKDVPLPLIVQNLHPDKNRNYGFYVIEDVQ